MQARYLEAVASAVIVARAALALAPAEAPGDALAGPRLALAAYLSLHGSRVGDKEANELFIPENE